MIDYNKIITITDIDMARYEKKFQIVDEYRKTQSDKLFDLIMNDITMFSYMFFKLDGKPLKLFPFQDIILSDIHRFNIFRASRQIGKSLALDIKAAYNLCVNHGHSHNECIISASLSQASFQMRRIKNLLNSANFDWTTAKGQTDNMSVVTIDIKDSNNKTMYTNMLVISPCTEAALGYDFHEVNLDETEYWKDVDTRYFFNNIIEPTISSTRGRLTTFSNPNGSETYVAELERHQLPNGTKKYHTYVFSYLDRPGNTQEDLDLISIEKTRQEMESQYLAIRSLSDRNFFTPDEIDRSYDASEKELNMVGKQAFAFLDAGHTHDQSTLYFGYVGDVEYIEGPEGVKREIKHIHIPIMKHYPVGYPISRVVGAYSDRQSSDGWHVEKSVKEYIHEWGKHTHRDKSSGSDVIFGCDITGNSGISPLFQSVGLDPYDIIFSGPKKSGMYGRFKWYMEKGLLHRIKSKEFEYQCAHLEMKKSASGYLRIHHESEKDLDDSPDTVAGLIELIDGRDYIPPTIEMI